jgi:HlyD family secretion protein
MLREMERANAAPRAELDDRKRHGLLQREANLSRQSAALRDRLANEQAMRRRGFVTDSQVIETRARIAEVENDLATIRGNLTELDVTNNENRARREREIRDAQLKVASLERDLETRKSEYTRGRTAFAPTSGTVVEVVHNPGDMITSGGTILRLLSGSGEEDSLSAIVYVPDTEGKKVKVGMEARIIPTTVKVEKSGFILARVTKVAELPATRDGLMRRLKNAALVDRLMGSGAPFEVEVALERADTPSGYRWSSGQGPDLTVDAGTMAEARVVVGRTPIIVLALPALNHLYRWADAL